MELGYSVIIIGYSNTVFHESVRHFGWIGVANLLVRACISFRLSTLNVDALGSQQGLEALATKDRR